MFDKIKKKLFISVGIGAVIYLALMVYADFDSLISSFQEFNWLLLPLLLFLSLLNYFTRFIKWDFYLKLLKIKIRKKDSLAIFMSGLIMSVTPGKMGELLKSYMVKQICNEPISKTAPIVVVERITDFLSLVLLSLMGSFVFDYGKTFTVFLLIFFLAVILVVGNRRISNWAIGILARLPYLRKYKDKISDAYESSYVMLKPIPLFFMTLVSIASWFFECFGFYIILLNFKVNFSLLMSTFIYAFSTIAGAVTMLPGGLGVTEGSLTFLIEAQNISTEIAVASTFIVRVVTLWFAVIVGIVSLMFYQKRVGKIRVE